MCQPGAYILGVWSGCDTPQQIKEGKSQGNDNIKKSCRVWMLVNIPAWTIVLSMH